MPVIYKDHINAYGYGSNFIDELRAKQGYTFAKSIKEPVNKAKYTQAQINDMCLTMRRKFLKLDDLAYETKASTEKINETLKASREVMKDIREFKENTEATDRLMKEI